MRFLPSTAPGPLARLPHRTGLLGAADEVRKARPSLPQESPEFHAAVLLLVACDTDFNVHRLVLRTWLPREFVARGLRRLADNGLWVDGNLRFNWLNARAESAHFWLDVDVALGRKLRREGATGTPEWAPAGGWVKDFEYRRTGFDRGSVVHAHYHDHPNRDSPPAATIDNRRAKAKRRLPAAQPTRPAQACAIIGRSGRREAAMMIRDWKNAHWLG